MMLQIPDVLNPAQLDTVRTLLSRARFVDGKLSAGMAAKRVKDNEELASDASEITQLNNIVMGSLVKHPMYQNGALPTRIAVPFYARYTAGKHYGDHVDDPIMGPPGQRYRSDVSITVFLNEPDEYVGGELTIRTAFGDRQVKLKAGDAVMYPSASLHHVAEVTGGERLVAVTWLQSMIRDPAKRELLYEMNTVREKLLSEYSDMEEGKKLDICYANLIRMWAEL